MTRTRAVSAGRASAGRGFPTRATTLLSAVSIGLGIVAVLGLVPSESPASAAEPAAEASWPEPVEKELYAKDFRGKKAPPFTVGEWLTRRPSHRGKVLLLDFWATWCPPCRKAIPELNRIHERFEESLVVIGVSDEEAGKVREFMKKARMDYPQAVDPRGKMKKALGIEGIPHVVIVSTDGVVRWQGFPFSREEPLTEEIIARIIAADPGVIDREVTDPGAGDPENADPAADGATVGDTPVHDEGTAQEADAAGVSGR